MKDEFVPYFPAPERVVELYEKLDKGENLEFEWRNPGRRPPTPQLQEKAEEAQAPQVEAENKDFDFEEEGGAGLVTPQRRNPGSELKGSARKQTTSLNSVLSNMKRHMKIEQTMDGAGGTPSS